MKILKMQTDLMSYRYTVSKIITCLAMYFIIAFRYRIFNITNEWWDVIITIVCMVLLCVCTLCLYLSVLEIFHTYLNRKGSNKTNKNRVAKRFSIEEIAKIVKRDDIIELEIVYKGAIIRIGASADCKQSSSVFFDKQYYIGNQEYATFEAFQRKLTSIQENGYVSVLSIDGVAINKVR